MAMWYVLLYNYSKVRHLVLFLFELPYSFKQVQYLIFIFAGTKWCGEMSAPALEPYGEYAAVDKCCKNHVTCPQIIPSNRSLYGLENTGIISR